MRDSIIFGCYFGIGFVLGQLLPLVNLIRAPRNIARTERKD